MIRFRKLSTERLTSGILEYIYVLCSLSLSKNYFLSTWRRDVKGHKCEILKISIYFVALFDNLFR